MPVPDSYNESQEFSEDSMFQGSKAWLDALHYMAEIGDSSLFISLSTNDCEMCSDVSKAFSNVYARGGWLASTGNYIFEFSDSVFVDNGSTSYIAADLIIPPETEYLRGREIVEDTLVTEPEVTAVEMVMIFDDTTQRWKMDTFYHLELEELE